MKSAAVVLGLLGLVAADATLPSCAETCVTKFTTGSNIGSCSSLDAKCICSDQDFLTNISCCVKDVCSASDQQATIDYAVQFCATQGVTGLPTTATCAATASNTWGTVASTASGSSATTSDSTITTTTASKGTTSAASSASSSSTASANLGAGSHAGAAGVFGGLIAAAAFL